MSNILNNDEYIFEYLGFMIIRPIPETFFGKVCLKIQKNYLESNILTQKYSVSFFGKILEVNSIAYQEQDRILSACATSSLWTYYHAHPKMELKNFLLLVK